ncbi:CYTH domain protein [Jeotgalicoccus saudimassiliensis]|uniref:CYTH domain protein n=1 Tax=Jeotgalicoccus saudimassiliensis TaxID=1461582 RepID=A0A078LZ02_9STAP|nr:CYTH domain-containing protein [Jeotgalicoccus saudimassiliensis]CDZ99200.1 CYTH domain protein [Jeotgalicoccus saudimassiliensis]
MFEKEIEFKNLLTENEYGKIQNDHFPRVKPMHLTNYYIDNDELQLIGNLLMLRIRVEDSRQLMTVKIPDEQHVVYEYSGVTDISLTEGVRIDEESIPENIREQLTKRGIPVNNLAIQGSLITERLEKPSHSGLLVLDKSSYLGTADYELEFEAPDVGTGKSEFAQILNKYGIVRREEIVKSARFYNLLKQQKGVN